MNPFTPESTIPIHVSSRVPLPDIKLTPETITLWLHYANADPDAIQCLTNNLGLYVSAAQFQEHFRLGWNFRELLLNQNISTELICEYLKYLGPKAIHRSLRIDQVTVATMFCLSSRATIENVMTLFRAINFNSYQCTRVSIWLLYNLLTDRKTFWEAAHGLISPQREIEKAIAELFCVEAATIRLESVNLPQVNNIDIDRSLFIPNTAVIVNGYKRLHATTVAEAAQPRLNDFRVESIQPLTPSNTDALYQVDYAQAFMYFVDTEQYATAQLLAWHFIPIGSKFAYTKYSREHEKFGQWFPNMYRSRSDFPTARYPGFESIEELYIPNTFSCSDFNHQNPNGIAHSNLDHQNLNSTTQHSDFNDRIEVTDRIYLFTRQQIQNVIDAYLANPVAEVTNKEHRKIARLYLGFIGKAMQQATDDVDYDMLIDLVHADSKFVSYLFRPWLKDANNLTINFMEALLLRERHTFIELDPKPSDLEASHIDATVGEIYADRSLFEFEATIFPLDILLEHPIFKWVVFTSFHPDLTLEIALANARNIALRNRAVITSLPPADVLKHINELPFRCDHRSYYPNPKNQLLTKLLSHEEKMPRVLTVKYPPGDLAREIGVLAWRYTGNLTPTYSSQLFAALEHVTRNFRSKYQCMSAISIDDVSILYRTLMSTLLVLDNTAGAGRSSLLDHAKIIAHTMKSEEFEVLGCHKIMSLLNISASAPSTIASEVSNPTSSTIASEVSNPTSSTIASEVSNPTSSTIASEVSNPTILSKLRAAFKLKGEISYDWMTTKPQWILSPRYTAFIMIKLKKCHQAVRCIQRQYRKARSDNFTDFGCRLLARNIVSGINQQHYVSYFLLEYLGWRLSGMNIKHGTDYLKAIPLSGSISEEFTITNLHDMYLWIKDLDISMPTEATHDNDIHVPIAWLQALTNCYQTLIRIPMV